MKKALLTLTAATLLCCLPLGASADEFLQQPGNTARVTAPSVPGTGSADYFTGAVKHLALFKNNSDATYTGSYVIFPAGARSNWHTHPGGQRLIVTKGVCWTQVWNGPKVEARAGDTIWCPPDVKHWHGASPEGEMIHIALTEVRSSKNVTWLEPVTDEQYYAE